jgi:hypothetical protein
MPPRSPSRDLADRYDGNRNYFRRPNWLDRWKWRLAALALLAAGGWIAAGYLRPGPDRDYQYTHGPLANPHAAWDSDCAACHKPTDPGTVSAGTILRADHRWLDLTCTTCHPGPPHFVTQQVKEGGADGCASCHPDHRGRDFSLVNLADTGCTVCHADLAARRDLPQGRIKPSITAFAEHPEFRALLDEQANKTYETGRGLKFSHAVHMSAGIVLPGAENKFTVGDLEKLSPGAAARLQPGKLAAAPVQLDCTACHQLDGRAGTKGFAKTLDALAAAPRTAGAPAGPEGAYFLPVKYDLHCKACHPTTAGQTAVGGTVLPSVPVPHGDQPDAVEKFLEGAYARALVGKDEKLQALKPAPGERFDPRPAPEAKAVGEALKAAVAKGMTDSLLVRPIAEGARGEGCLKCHDLTPGEGKYGRVKPVSQRSVWFAAAKFTHAPHLSIDGVTCLTCHPGAGAEPKLADGRLVEREPLDILGVASCQTCHGPKSATPGSGARSTCTECHRYHLGERPTRGLGK